MNRVLVATAALLLSTLAVASIEPSAPPRLPVPEEETLPNGLKLVWFLNDRLPVLDVVLLAESGSRDDPAGKSGSAELLGAVLDRGAGGRSASAFSLESERLGATKYISTGDDTMTAGVHGLAIDGEKLLGILADLVRRPNLEPADVKREQARLVDQWKHLGDSADLLASVAFARKIASGTDYARGNALSMRELSALRPEDVRRYYERHFVPGNCVLMVVGRADRAEFRRRILERFGDWKGAKPKKAYTKARVPALETARGQVLLVDKPGATQTQIRMGFRIPLLASPNRYPLAVANALLGEYFLSRLNAVIRDELGLTYGIGSTISYDPGLARIVISSATQSAQTGKLIRKAEEIVADLRKNAVTETELRLAKEYLVGGFPVGMSTLGAVASRWLAGHVFRLGPEYLNEYIPKVTEVTVEQVRKAVREDFDLEGMSIVVAGDAQEIEKVLRASDFKVKRAKVSDLF